MSYVCKLYLSVTVAALSAPAMAQQGTITSSPVPQGASPTPKQGASGDGAVSNDLGTPTSANPQQDTGALEDIVVTAQKREQNLQDVPVAVTAITADTLEARGIQDITDVARVAPSLTVTESGQATNNSINLRGIGTQAFSIGVESAVAVVVDDVALVQQGQAFSGLADVARIEVLRGPQGTLFGKNASAGVINIVTQAPTSTLTGSIGAVATTDTEWRVEGSLSGPLAEGIRFRVNGYYGDRDGYVRNLATGNLLNGERGFGLRGRLDLQPASNLDIALSASYAESDVNGVSRTIRSATPNARLFGALLSANLADTNVGPNNYRVRLDIEPLNESRNQVYIGRATLDLGAVSLVSISSYQRWDYSFLEDLDNTAVPTLTTPTNLSSAPIPGGSYQRSNFKTTNFTQELRLASKGGGDFNYLLGLFYSDSKTGRDLDRGPNSLANFVADVGNKTYAAFGQATYDILPTTHIDVGLRYNYEKINVGFTNGIATAATCRTGCYGNDDEDAFVYKAALRHDINDDIMVYGSYAKGYKGQGYDVSTSFTPAQAAQPVASEKSNSYEAGVKSRFLDRKVQLNIAAFLTDYRNFQAQGVEEDPTAPGTFVNRLRNVGKVRSKGIEVDLSARPFNPLRLDVTAAYIDAEIRSYRGASCYNGQTLALGCIDINPSPTVLTGSQDLTGRPLANSPRFKYSFAATYDVALPNLPFDGFITAEWAHRSGANLDLLGNPRLFQEGYGVFNGSIGIRSDDSRGYRIALFVNNLFDRHYATALGTGNGGSTTALGDGYTINDVVTQVLPRNSLRYFGIRARFGF